MKLARLKIASVKTEIKMTITEKENERQSKKKNRGDQEPNNSNEDDHQVKNKNSNKGNGQRKKWLYPDKFDGSTPLNLLLTSVEICASYNNWDDRD